MGLHGAASSAPPAPERAREPRTIAPFGRRCATVRANRPVGAYRLLEADDATGPSRPRPGQFYMLAAAERWGGHDAGRPYLPRAFSFCRSEPRAGEAGATLSFLLEAIGPGTGRLGELGEGEELLLTGPLGIGFSRPRGRPLLVGGGIGVAPLLCLHDELGDDARVLLGFRSSAHAEARRLFEASGAGPLSVTDDGSVGRRALVTELLAEELDRDPSATVYACGPPAMLEGVRALCARDDVDAQLALESGMACGYGACFGCVVPTERGYLRLCVDGPVLDARLLTTALGPGAGH